MLLNSLFFIFAFLPAVLLIYYLLPAAGRNWFLLAASLVFYAWGDPVYLILLIFSAVFHYIMGLQIGGEENDGRRKKQDLIFAVGVDVFLLCFFKYFGPAANLIGSFFHTQIAVRELALPIGLSFYTFKNLSYLFDIYYGRTEAEKKFTDFAAYAVFFPAMTAGPIVRYKDMKEQMKKRRVNALQLGYGARRFILGLAKKVLLADTLASLYGEISAGAGNISVLTAWIGMFAFTMEIYFDFSGYSDMAIGISRMLGFTVKENFDYPYILRSTSDSRKIYSWQQAEKTAGLGIRDLYDAAGNDRLDAVFPQFPGGGSGISGAFGGNRGRGSCGYGGAVLSEDKPRGLPAVHTCLQTGLLQMGGEPVPRFYNWLRGAVRRAVSSGDSLPGLQLLPSFFIPAFLIKQAGIPHRNGEVHE